MDDASGLSMVRLIKMKSEPASTVKEMITKMEQVKDGKVKRLLGEN